MASPYVQNVSTFSSPGYDYSADLSAIARRQKLADALQQQATAPIEQQTAGGYVVPISPWQGMSRIAQALLSHKMASDSEDQQRQLSQKSQDDYSNMTRAFSKALMGTPATPAQPGMIDEVGGINQPEMPGKPAVAPDPMAAMSIANQHPMGAPLAGMAATYAQQEMNRQRMAQVLGQFGIGSPSANGPQAMGAEAASGGQAGPTNAAAGRIGQPNGGFMVNPLAAALMGSSNDPNAMTEIAKMQEARAAKRAEVINMRPGGTAWSQDGGPMFTAPQNGMQTTWGPGGPSAALVPNAQELTARQGGLTAASEAYGRLPYQTPTTYQTPGAPTAYTPSQAITQSGGTIPTPESLFPPPGTAPQAPTPPGMVPQGQINPDGSTQPAVPISQIPASDVAAARAAGVKVNQPQTGRRVGMPLQDNQDQAQQTASGKELAALQYNAPMARSSVADATNNLDRLVQVATQVQNDPALSRITGLAGSLPNMPGYGAADVQAKLESLKSQIGFSVLQAMRDASKTGGALGAISDRENELLQRNLAALDTKQSPEAMQKSLQTVIDYAMGAKQRILSAYHDQYDRVQGNQGMQPTPQGARPTSASPQDIVNELRRRGVVQ